MTKRRPAHWYAVALIAAALTLPCRGLAADAETAVVTVTAPRMTEAERQAPTSFVTSIDTATHAQEVETVTDALAESVGVSVRRFGGLGAFSTVSIRGSSANQVQIYMDGVPMARARNETVNLADLPIDSLARIDVYRGTAPVSFGAAGIGGVVNLVTKPPSVTPETQMSASYGSFDTRKVVASRTEQIHGVDFLGYLTYLGSAGDFSFLEQSPLAGKSVAHLIEQTRMNNAFDSVEALLKGGYSIAPRLRLDVTSETFFKDQGVPGLDENQSLIASFDDLRSLTYLRLTSSDGLARGLDLSGTLYGVYEQAHFKDPNPHGDLGTGQQNRDDRTGVVGGTLNGSYDITDGQHLAWSTEVSHETFAPSNSAPNAPHESDAGRLHSTVALQHQASLFREYILLVPTLRYEHVGDELSGPLQTSGEGTIQGYTRDHELFSPSIGGQARLLPWFALRGNIARVERAPNFGELFGNSGSVVGNPTLRPETALNRDIGFSATVDPCYWIDRVRLEYVYFNNDISDLIVLLELSRAVGRNENIVGARVRGHELSFETTLVGHLRLDANYTHQDTDNRSRVEPQYAGKQLPERPADELYTRVELFDEHGRLYYELNFVSGNFLDQRNFGLIPSRAVHTIGAAYRIIEPVTLSVEARNLTDNRISDVAGFPLPGRAFFGTVAVKF